MTVKETARRAGVCERVVRGWVAEGRLAHFRLGAAGKRGKIVVAERDLDALLDSLRVGATARPPAAGPVPPPPPLKHLRMPS